MYQFQGSRLLQNNNITGGIPPGLGNLRNLQTLDLSNNKLSGSIPESLGLLNNLQYLRLNNNTLSGAIPLTRLTKLTFLDLSFKNISGPVAKFPATTFKYASPAENNSIFVKETSLHIRSEEKDPVTTTDA
ncbi:hypothetical protein POM88_044531 [Heracleum sosnowskyi]|uniref:Uncharacterized protein n=1 Tax=Heracleum sosnowskyi TaxID=360622 RepID=A0AAD8H5L4_9APIA|nr:hypothetical protein POM88_044531 [Heracleum sosnowskyi]